MLVVKHTTTIMVLTTDYIKGILQSKGSFSFSNLFGKKLPTFSIQVEKDKEKLIIDLKKFLIIKEPVYYFKEKIGNDGYKRDPYCKLMVRSFGSLKNSIVPFCYKNLNGFRKEQFNHWIEIIGKDDLVPNNYKLLYRLCGSGYWDKNPTYF